MLALLAKEIIPNPTNKVLEFPAEVTLLLTEFYHVAAEELPKELPPMRENQHAIDLVPGSQLPNFSYYGVNPKSVLKN